MNPRAAAALRELTNETEVTRPEREWHLLSAHGTVLFYIVYNQGCSIEDISNALFLTRRSIWGTIGDLRRAGMVIVHKEGRKHRYFANFDAELRHPLFRGKTMRGLLSSVRTVGTDHGCCRRSAHER
jgi:biotin operon repressor